MPAPRESSTTSRRSQLGQAARIVEIGCRSGQATRQLAERGYQITCVELGEQLAAAARRNLSQFRSVEVINADFETWSAPGAEFDAVVAFTAFHWINPDVRYRKTASLLRDRGVLAVLATRHVLPPDGDEFFVEVQEDYEAVVPEDPKTRAGGPSRPDAIADLSDEISASGFFRNLAARRYPWDVTYTADEYVAVLDLLRTSRSRRRQA